MKQLLEGGDHIYVVSQITTQIIMDVPLSLGWFWKACLLSDYIYYTAISLFE